MSHEALSVALEREHLQVDAGFGAFLDGLEVGCVDADGLGTTLAALRRHIYLEEQLLFPPISRGAHMMAVFGMIRGHGEIWRTMNALDDLAGAGADCAILRDTCEQLRELLAEHNKVEEPVIYPAADTGLTAEQTAELAGFLTAGRMPDGWTCARAAA
ncbi:hemerythrin domain-containing protein [Mycolicibacterium mageritense]|jgi:iron-sulfur cluster repair protein YtfE (RIC family)|uniref:hemerythrin domain-containing protein n=1 Tax=Mycolicibacterium mageritense TaxID=53462 RepID=UPI0011D5EFB3|nr:hemerythrin domain-containing protein [Mycolicibacterium mageritense]TXI62887.1 MAG: hemerythrin domain-containing protein [Mycolicibacterium mageritense]